MKYKLFSVDDHIVEHPRVWTDRLPAKYLEIGPHVVEENGNEYWQFEDKRVQTVGLGAVAGKDFEDIAPDPVRFTDMIPGCYDPHERAKDFETDGIVASLAFPTLPRFSGVEFAAFHDKELADLCVKAWNDFLLDEWCAADPARYVPMIIGQLWDPALMAEEIYRCSFRGARAVTFPENPGVTLDKGLEHRSSFYSPGAGTDKVAPAGNDTWMLRRPMGLPSFHSDAWDPVWRAATETDTVVCFHVGSSGVVPTTSADAPLPAIQALSGTVAQVTLVEVAMSTITHRFPTIKFVLSEGGIGWIPAALERADKVWERNRHWSGLTCGPPSEVFQRNFWVCAIDEVMGMSMRDLIGLDKILWECDYPHSDSSWPHSQMYAEKMFADFTDGEIAAVTHQNAAALFRWPV